MTFVAYDVCRLIGFVAYEVCSIMTFVANYDVCRLEGLSQYHRAPPVPECVPELQCLRELQACHFKERESKGARMRQKKKRDNYMNCRTKKSVKTRLWFMNLWVSK